MIILDFLHSKVSNASKVGAFFKLLARWKGSMYKLIYTEYVNVKYY